MLKWKVNAPVRGWRGRIGSAARETPPEIP